MYIVIIIYRAIFVIKRKGTALSISVLFLQDQNTYNYDLYNL